jgi:hypothetical protein
VAIVLQPGTYQLTIPESSPFRGADGELRIQAGTTTIRGAGADATTIEQTVPGRVLQNVGGVITLEGLTITGGRAENGGGIGNGRELTLRNVTVRDNESEGGSGGIWSIGTLRVLNSEITDN